VPLPDPETPIAAGPELSAKVTKASSALVPDPREMAAPPVADVP
jgi:hypothetical protein